MSRYIDSDKLRKDEIARCHCVPVVGSGDNNYKDLDEVLNEQPTADVVEVRHGEWIWDFNMDGDDFFRCSVCGRQEVINGLCRERNPIEEFPYCHCGAKMDGERRTDDEG